MKNAYWRIIAPVRKRIKSEIPPSAMHDFLRSVAQEACIYFRSAMAIAHEDGNGESLNNFLRTPKSLRRCSGMTDELSDEILLIVNSVGRESWDIVVNHIMMKRLERIG